MWEGSDVLDAAVEVKLEEEDTDMIADDVRWDDWVAAEEVKGEQVYA